VLVVLELPTQTHLVQVVAILFLEASPQLVVAGAVRTMQLVVLAVLVAVVETILGQAVQEHQVKVLQVVQVQAIQIMVGVAVGVLVLLDWLLQ
jgi:hypothetical protein